MRAIVILCLAWCVAICATPGLADRFLPAPQVPMQHIVANGLSYGRGESGVEPIYAAAQARLSCPRGEGGTNATVMPARYDQLPDGARDVQKIDANYTVGQPVAANFAADCR